MRELHKLWNVHRYLYCRKLVRKMHDRIIVACYRDRSRRMTRRWCNWARRRNIKRSGNIIRGVGVLNVIRQLLLFTDKSPLYINNQWLKGVKQFGIPVDVANRMKFHSGVTFYTLKKLPFCTRKLVKGNFAFSMFKGVT